MNYLHKWLVIAAILVLSIPTDGQAQDKDTGAATSLKPPAAGGNLSVPEVCVYIANNFGGGEWCTTLGYSWVGQSWSDQISSIIVKSGKWRFFEHKDYGGANWDVSTGYYPNMPSGIPGDVISSFKPISY